MNKLPIWTPLASAALAVTWLLPNGSPPWISFHKDAWLALVCLLVAIVILSSRRSARHRFSLDYCSLFLLVCALYPLLQLQLGIIFFSGHAWLGFGYFLAGSVAVILGRALDSTEGGWVARFLFPAFLASALLTGFLMMVQWLRLEVNLIWIAPVPDSGRPYGNLMQPNNAASLILLGMVALFWLLRRNLLSFSVIVVCAFLLCFFLAISGSRIGYLSFFGLMLAGTLAGFKEGRDRALSLTCVGIFLWFLLCLRLVTMDWGDSLSTTTGTQALDRDLTSVRTSVWKAYIEAAFSRPLLGFGFEQGAKTQLAASALGHELPGLFTWSHNALLDLATWFGLPLAFAGIISALALLIAIVRSPMSGERVVYIAGVFVLLMHGMVELPLAFAYFFLPFCFMVGAITATIRWPSVGLSLSTVRALVAALATLLSLIIYDYFRIEASFYTWRFMNANVGRFHPMDIPDTLLLNQHEALLRGLRADPANVSEKTVSEFKEALYLDPSAAGLQHLAMLQVKRGDILAAQSTADIAFVLTRWDKRRQLAARWKYLGTLDPVYLSVRWREE